MLRLLHTADLHLGARHEDLGEAAATIRERQLAALRATVDLALAEHVDAVLVAGCLFSANTVSRRTVEAAAAELARLASARVPVVLVPGEHDAYTRSSVYRAYDLPALAGAGMVTVLTPAAPFAHLDALDAVVVGPADTGRPSAGPFADLASGGLPATTWRVGLLPAAPGDGQGNVSAPALEASGLDYAALGGGSAAADGKAGRTVWATPGPPDSTDAAQPGTATLVTLEDGAVGTSVAVATRVVGTTVRRAFEVDLATIATQDVLVEQLRAEADPSVVLDVRLVGTRPDELELDPAAVEDAVRDACLAVRVADASRPPLSEGPLPPPETIAGAFIRNVEGRIADLEASGGDADEVEAAELREVLRLGRRLLAGAEVAS